MAAGDKITIATITDINDATSSIVTTATGTILTFSSAVAPTGFLECDGAAISRTTYADLFAVISDSYGVGDGSTTFNIPDLRGEFIRGFDNGKGTDAGRVIGSGQTEDTAPHGHTGSSNTTGNHSHLAGAGNPFSGTYDYGLNVYDSPTSSAVDSYINTSATGNHSHTLTINNSSGTETRPRNIAMMFCIKT